MARKGVIRVQTSDGFMSAPKPKASISSANPANPFYPGKSRGLPANKRGY